MTLVKDLLHKHKNLQQASTSSPPRNHNNPARRSTDRTTASGSDQSTAGPDLVSRFDSSNPVPEFTFLRTTTNTQEIIEPPHYPEDDQAAMAKKEAGTPEKADKPEKKRMSIFRSRSGTGPPSSPSNQSLMSDKSDGQDTNGHGGTNGSPPAKPTGGLAQPARPDMKRKISDRLHLTSRARSQSRAMEQSPYIPDNLGDAPEPTPAPLEAPDMKGRVKAAETKEAKAAREALWEQRACTLAMNLHVPATGPWGMATGAFGGSAPSPRRTQSGTFIDAKQEDNIQEAIRLHESGDLERSTIIFGRLADPKGANNPLSQVLYGLALRHGWGIESSADLAILYLSLAARTSAQIQQLSAAAGVTGDAKGELVLAIYELGNCFRFGWGCKVDKPAARLFYEVSANLGDPDALEETAWCLMEGFGGSKDKFRAAQYYRLAECAGRKRVGDSWIWKDKYHPSAAKS